MAATPPNPELSEYLFLFTNIQASFKSYLCQIKRRESCAWNTNRL